LRDSIGIGARRDGERFELVREVAAWGCVDGVTALLSPNSRVTDAGLAAVIVMSTVPKAAAGNSMK
jgi:hypothetical protein